jgi:HAE1 family hydrophobic/amphiphilic exporter-1
MLTLYTTPVVFIYLDRLNEWLGGRRAPAADVASDAQPRKPELADVSNG